MRSVSTGHAHLLRSPLVAQPHAIASTNTCITVNVVRIARQQAADRRSQHAPRFSRHHKVSVMAAAAGSEKKTGVLFVCLGNICRSPAAEAVFRAKVDEAGLSDSFLIDSCGTGGGVRNWYKGAKSYHEGGPADFRMMETAAKRNIDITSTSRPLKPDDLQKFDYILGMDFENQAAIQVAADYWAGQGEDIPADYRNKVSLMCTHLQSDRFKGVREVPDPYYDHDDVGFNKVLDLLEDSCQGLLDKIVARK